jgi:hypothetical protein
MRINLFIFISNTYSGLKRLNGIRKEREDLAYALDLNSFSNQIINDKFINIQKNLFLKEIRFCFLNDCNKNELTTYLNKLKNKYNYFNIILCLSGHGCNSSGLCTFQTQDYKIICLSEIISILNTDSLINITVLLDMCRSGRIVNKSLSTNLQNLITNKRVSVITPVRRGENTKDTLNGGYLIQALVKTIRQNDNILIQGLFSFQDTIRLIKYIVWNNIEIKLKMSSIIDNLSLRTFLNGIKKNTHSIYREIQREMCNQFPSVYLSSEARVYLERLPDQLLQYKTILDLLNRKVSDLSLEDAVVRINPTEIIKK